MFAKICYPAVAATPFCALSRHCGPFYVVPEQCECPLDHSDPFLASLGFETYPVYERQVGVPPTADRGNKITTPHTITKRAIFQGTRTRWRSTSSYASNGTCYALHSLEIYNKRDLVVTFCRHAPLWWCMIQNDRFKQCATRHALEMY